MSLPMSQYTSSTILLISPLLLLPLLLGSISAEASVITISPHHSHPLSPASDFIVPPESQRNHLPPTPHAKAPAATPIAFAPHNSNPLIATPNSNVPPKPKQHHRKTTPHVKSPAPATIIAFSPHNSHPLIPAPDFIVPPGPQLTPPQSAPHAKAPAAPLIAFSPHNSHPLIPTPESIVPSVAPANSQHAHNQQSHNQHRHHHHHLPPKNIVGNSPSLMPSPHFNMAPAAPPIAFSPPNSHPLIQAPESIVPSEAHAHPLHAQNTPSHHHHYLLPKNVVANPPSPTPLHFNKPNLPPFIPLP